MVDVVADRGQQVDQLLPDPGERAGEGRHVRLEVPDALALEARVVGHDPSCAGAGLDQGTGEGGPGLLRAVSDPLVVVKQAAAALRVTAELHRHVLPRPATVPARAGEAARLEDAAGERRG